MKDIIQNYGWECIDPKHMQKTFIWYKNFEILEDGEWFESCLIIRLRENHEGETHLTIRELSGIHTKKDFKKWNNLDTFSKSEYLFQGWLLEDTKEEFESIMKRLRV